MKTKHQKLKFVIIEKKSQFSEHSHSEGQFLYVFKGSLWVEAGNKKWYLHAKCGLWIPPHMPHSSFQSKTVEIISVYIDQKNCKGPLGGAFSVRIEPLLRELLKYIRKNNSNPNKDREVFDLLLHQILLCRTRNIFLPSTTERRLLNCIDYVTNNISLNPSLVDVGRISGASAKTLERLFRRELGTDFREWKQQLKMVLAVSYLLEGMPITEIALTIGYNSMSAFIHCFKKYYQSSPTQYLKIANSSD